jgi:hypothetical protein
MGTWFLTGGSEEVIASLVNLVGHLLLVASPFLDGHVIYVCRVVWDDDYSSYC